MCLIPLHFPLTIKSQPQIKDNDSSAFTNSQLLPQSRMKQHLSDPISPQFPAPAPGRIRNALTFGQVSTRPYVITTTANMLLSRRDSMGGTA